MTTIEKHEPSSDLNLPSMGQMDMSADGVKKIKDWADAFQAALAIAQPLCQTAFVPQHFRGKPEDTAIAIMHGANLGFGPIDAVQNIFVISGKPGMYARTMVAILKSVGHEVWTEESSDQSVTVSGSRKGSKHVETSTWTIQRAHTAGYTSNPNYKKDPQAMLYARAAGDVCRRIAPDALLGIAYTVEEMQMTDMGDDAAWSSKRKTETKDLREPAPPAMPQPAFKTSAPESSGRDWEEELNSCTTLDEVNALKKQVPPAEQSRELGKLFADVTQALANTETGELIEGDVA